MTDTHSHILFDVDDGSSSIEESIELLKQLATIGFKHVILTPHYIEGSQYNSFNQEKKTKFQLLQQQLKKEALDLEIHLGNEIYIHQDIITSLKQEKIFSLNNTKYLLIEFPFYNQVLNLDDLLYELKYHGFIPVIAHPERYEVFQKNPSLIEDLKANGILFQANYASILGYYGSKAKKLVKYLFKHHYIDFLGTDIHHLKKSFVIDNFPKIQRKIIKLTGPTYYQQIQNNANQLVSYRN